MAQTKTRSKPKSKSQSKPKARTSSANGKKANTRSKPKAASRSNASRSNSKSSSASKPKAAVEAVEETVKDAGKSVGNAASSAGKSVGSAASKAGHAVGKAKVPLMAGGAALAGVAGGMALGNRQSHRPHRIKGSLKKVDSGDLAKAARKVGDFSAQIGELALEAKRIREESNGKGNRSPIEVVLDGLTARRGSGRR